MAEADSSARFHANCSHREHSMHHSWASRFFLLIFINIAYHRDLARSRRSRRTTRTRTRTKTRTRKEYERIFALDWDGSLFFLILWFFFLPFLAGPVLICALVQCTLGVLVGQVQCWIYASQVGRKRESVTIFSLSIALLCFNFFNFRNTFKRLAQEESLVVVVVGDGAEEEVSTYSVTGSSRSRSVTNSRCWIVCYSDCAHVLHTNF